MILTREQILHDYESADTANCYNFVLDLLDTIENLERQRDIYKESNAGYQRAAQAILEIKAERDTAHAAAVDEAARIECTGIVGQVIQSLPTLDTSLTDLIAKINTAIMAGRKDKNVVTALQAMLIDVSTEAHAGAIQAAAGYLRDQAYKWPNNVRQPYIIHDDVTKYMGDENECAARVIQTFTSAASRRLYDLRIAEAVRYEAGRWYQDHLDGFDSVAALRRLASASAEVERLKGEA